MVSLSWSFSPGGIAELGGRIIVVMQVIWAIGAGMVVLSVLQLLGRRACLAIGVVILAGHNLLDGSWPAASLFDTRWPVWVSLHSQMALNIGPLYILFVYPLLVWVGVITLGFGVSGIFELPPERRNALLLRAGIVLTLFFLLLRAIDLYGDPNPWHLHEKRTATVIDFLNTTKYPPSLAFLLMTLGQAAVVCAVADRLKGRLRDTLVMFGRVPFGFYIPHFFLIHSLSVLLGVIQGFDASQLMTAFFFYPKNYGIGLPGVYAFWILVMAVVMYPFCRWYAGVKTRRRDWWLSYL